VTLLIRSFRCMEQPTRRPEPSTDDPAEGRPGLPEKQNPRRPRPEPDPFPGYGEPPPNVPRRGWGPGGGKTGP